MSSTFLGVSSYTHGLLYTHTCTDTTFLNSYSS